MRANKSSMIMVYIFSALASCFLTSSCAQKYALYYKELTYPKLGDIEIPEVE